MKRIGIALGIIVLFAALAPATAEAQGGIRLGKLGVKGGYLSAKLSGSPEAGSPATDVEYDSDAGFGVGLYLRGYISDNFALQSEVLYLQRRTTSETLVGNSVVANEIKAGYLQVPVQIRYVTSATGRVSPVFFAGPAFSYRLDMSADGGNDGLVDPIDIEDETEKAAIELVAGAGVEVGNLSFEARYTWGLQSVFVDAKQADYKWRELGLFASFGF